MIDIWLKSSADLPADKQTKFSCQKPASAIVWTAVFKTGKSSLIFVKEGAMVNTTSFINDFLVPAFAAAKQHFKEEVFTFQQDGAPSQTSKKDLRVV
jgi:hypothetical protein